MTIELTRIVGRVRMRQPRELGRGKYSARQLEDEVMVTAVGETPTPNYKVWLALGPERVFPPIVELWWMKPPGPQLQVMTPFSVHMTFTVGDQPIGRISVRDADGTHEIPVEQTDDPGVGPGGEKTYANSFRLTWGKLSVSYATTSFMGVPILSIGNQHYSGDELHIVETEIGQQVTVITEQVPDLKVVTFTLIVPPVLLAGTRPAKVEIPAVQATHHTTIAGPPLGQNISYEQVMLPGVAEFIVA